MSLQTDSIGLLTWDYARPKGGMGRALQATAELLRAQGKTVHIASPQAQEPLLALTERTGKHLLFSLLLPFVLRSWIHRKSVQTLLVPVGPGGVFLLQSVNVRCAGIVYHTYYQQAHCVPGQAWKKIFIPLERLTLRRCRRIICYSADTQRVLQEHYTIPAARISLCAHPLDTQAWKRAGQDTPGLCVCVARLEARKGVDVLMRAWPAVIAAVPHARLQIIGSGLQAAAIDAQISRVSESVTRTERMSFPELTDVLGRAEVALCPAYLEGYGLAAAEAMAAGATVIASDCDGLRSLLTNNETGILVEPGNSSALADAIIRVLQDKALRMRLSSAAQLHIRQACSPSRATQELVAAVEAAEVTEAPH